MPSKKKNYSTATIPLPDFVVLDLNMPILDGVGALKQIKKHEEMSSIPIFILSTSRNPEEIDQCEALGCDGFYTKPIQIKQLKQIIEDILERTNLD